MAFSVDHSLRMVVAIAAVLYTFLQGARADFAAPAPAPASDGNAIDQGIAYTLMLLALVLTYLIH